MTPAIHPTDTSVIPLTIARIAIAERAVIARKIWGRTLPKYLSIITPYNLGHGISLRARSQYRHALYLFDMLTVSTATIVAATPIKIFPNILSPVFF